jgi:hypothetical protein
VNPQLRVTVSNTHWCYLTTEDIDGLSIATGAPGMQETGSVLTYMYQEEPISFYDELAREVWANATMNSTVD